MSNVKQALDRLRNNAGTWMSAAIGCENTCQECQDDFEQALKDIELIRQYIEAQEWRFLCKDDKEQALWQAIQNITFGNKTDDKLIVAELEKLGFTVIRFSEPPQGEDNET